jgi:MFS superfamily sulfate permease-like transporter
MVGTEEGIAVGIVVSLVSVSLNLAKPRPKQIPPELKD